ncbi:MAG: MurR/RpiR family transcriptional regulator, partial [Paraburkholderia graminis]
AVLAVIEALCDAVAYRAKRSVKAAAEVTEFVLPWLTDPLSASASASTVAQAAGAAVAKPRTAKAQPKLKR